MLTKEQLKKMQGLEARATKGPWYTGNGDEEDFFHGAGTVICGNRVICKCNYNFPQALADGPFIAEARDFVPAALAHIAKLEAIIAAHDLCHNLHGKVDAAAFAEGCADEQRKLYGCAPHADKIAEQAAEIERLRDTVGDLMSTIEQHKLCVKVSDHIEIEGD